MHQNLQGLAACRWGCFYSLLRPAAVGECSLLAASPFPADEPSCRRSNGVRSQARPLIRSGLASPAGSDPGQRLPCDPQGASDDRRARAR